LIQRKLVVLLGFWVISASVLSQLFPSVVLAHFHHDDAKTASFLGWVNGVSSLLQFLVLPSLSASVDITGRKRMLIISAAAQAAAAAAWGCAPSNIILATLTWHVSTNDSALCHIDSKQQTNRLCVYEHDSFLVRVLLVNIEKWQQLHMSAQQSSSN
jgi:MFS-type transporter involved in bile tolerance (Atg22 family)